MLKQTNPEFLQTPGFGVGGLVEDIAGSLSGRSERSFLELVAESLGLGSFLVKTFKFGLIRNMHELK